MRSLGHCTEDVIVVDRGTFRKSLKDECEKAINDTLEVKGGIRLSDTTTCAALDGSIVYIPSHEDSEWTPFLCCDDCCKSQIVKSVLPRAV